MYVSGGQHNQSQDFSIAMSSVCQLVPRTTIWISKEQGIFSVEINRQGTFSVRIYNRAFASDQINTEIDIISQFFKPKIGVMMFTACLP
jgi:hypothetical protein